VLRRSYLENGDLDSRIPAAAGVLPPLLDRVLPVHAVVAVDVFIPGCPPPAPRIRKVLEQLVTRHKAQLTGTDLKFG
jgi:NAD-reducing hydrogenase small subunit